VKSTTDERTKFEIIQHTWHGKMWPIDKYALHP